MLVAVNAKSGEQAWAERGFPMVSIVHADGKLILLDENGQLTLATVEPKGLTIRSRYTITEKYSLTAPALAGTTLFVRDRKRIVALALGLAEDRIQSVTGRSRPGGIDPMDSRR